MVFQQPFELNVVLNGVMPDGSVTHISNNVHQKSRTLHCIDVSVHTPQGIPSCWFLFHLDRLQNTVHLLWVLGSRLVGCSLPVGVYEQDASPLPTPYCNVTNMSSEALWIKASDNY